MKTFALVLVLPVVALVAGLSVCPAHQGALVQRQQAELELLRKEVREVDHLRLQNAALRQMIQALGDNLMQLREAPVNNQPNNP